VKISVLITTYNYGRFLGQAIDSVLSQSRPADEVIVVDDGSTDETDTELRPVYEKNDRIKWIRQPNGGQLAAFQAGVLSAAGDIFFFLDADDYYHTDHLKLVMEYYEKNPAADFIFTDVTRFRGEKADAVDSENPERHDYGISIVRTFFKPSWIGNVTSALSCKTSVIRRLFPFPDEIINEWRIEADICLVFGTALAGANKHYYGLKTVNYREHDSNHYFGREQSEKELFLRKIKKLRFQYFLADKFNLGGYLLQHAQAEFLTIPHPCENDIEVYEKIGRMRKKKKMGRMSRLKKSYKKRMKTLKKLFSIGEVKETSVKPALKKGCTLVENMDRLQKEEERASSVLNRTALPFNAVPDGSIILDIGANIGGLARKFRTLFPQAQIRSIEADPSTFEQLKLNTAGDPLIRIYQCAIHSCRATIPFYSHENPLLSSVKQLSSDGVPEKTDAITVEAVSLDEFVVEQGVENIALIKIDTEGNDLNVLKGAHEVLQSPTLTHLIIEFGIDPENQRQCHINDLILKLIPYGFHVKCMGDWGVYRSGIYGNCLFERGGLSTPVPHVNI